MILYPCSKEAMAEGCMCRPNKNDGGVGLIFGASKLFEVYSECPIHGEEVWMDNNKTEGRNGTGQRM